jgi:FRG domain
MGKKVTTGEVASFGALHNRLSSYSQDWIFRGHADANWRLVPKAGRKPYSGREADLFERWKRSAVEHMTSHAATNWDFLAIAQHHGLATRLLDWTINPLNAAFFAVQESRPGPAIIHAARFKQLPPKSAERIYKEEPLSVKGVAIFRPRGVVPRIVRQSGLFTVHGPPETALDSFDPEIVTLV